MKVSRRKTVKRKNYFFKKLILFFGFFLVSLISLLSMKVRTIDIKGAKRVDASEVLKKSGIDINFPLILLNTLKIKKEIKQIPLVKDVNIDRNFPNKILINIFERTPKFIVFDLNKYYLIDEDGFLVEVLEKAPDNKEFLLIEYVGEIKNVKIGKKLELRKCNNAFFKFINELKESEKKKIKNLIVDSKGTSIVFNSGLMVFLGNDKYLNKLKLLPYIYKAAKSEKINISKIDINYIEVPYIISKSE